MDFPEKFCKKWSQGSRAAVQCNFNCLYHRFVSYTDFLCSQGHTNHGMDHATPDLPTLEKPTLDKSITDNCKEESHHLEIWKPD